MGKGSNGCNTSTGRGGLVLNISSVHGLLNWPMMPAYAAGKSGIIQFTRCMGHNLEFASHGVKIVCLCPNAVDSGRFDFHPYVGMTNVGLDYLDSLDCSRMLTTHEVAEADVKVTIKNVFCFFISKTNFGWTLLSLMQNQIGYRRREVLKLLYFQ
jgi:short-subunit dehydrogenase